MTSLAVIGLWHLGCSITASWLKLGYHVVAVDFQPGLVNDLRAGRPPIYEPGLAEALTAGLQSGRLIVTEDPASIADCEFVFITYDTPVRDDETSDITPVETALDRAAPKLRHLAVVIVSSQLPIGTSRQLRSRLRDVQPEVELVYSPENLRLSEAIRCYLEPGHIVIGGESDAALDRVERLFGPMKARIFRMRLASAELVKHGINTFLATSVTLANQWSDIAEAFGADFAEVAAALRADPRIGQQAYLSPGIGFSGGTLGRDLRVLDEFSQRALGGRAPMFGEILRYNAARSDQVIDRIFGLVGTRDPVALLGMTYKPGTSTLRRSLPLEIAHKLRRKKVKIQVHDPRADWSELAADQRFGMASDAYAAAEGASLLVILTEWPEYAQLDFDRLGRSMVARRILDPKGVLGHRASELKEAGFTRCALVLSGAIA